jgi:hypothetical protein
LRLPIIQSDQFLRGLELNMLVVDDQDRRPAGPPDKNDGIVPDLLSRQRECAASQRIVDALGEWALANDCEFSRCRDPTTDQGTEDEGNGSLGSQRLSMGRSLVKKDGHSETTSA